MVANQGANYYRIAVDTENFNTTTLEDETRATSATYTLQIDDVSSGVSGNIGTNVGGASMDLAEWTYKAAGDYKGNDLVHLEISKRLRYYSYRSIQIDTSNTPRDIFSGSGVGVVNNNVLKVTASPDYSTNKTLTDLNNDFIDSIKLFNTKEIIPNNPDEPELIDRQQGQK